MAEYSFVHACRLADKKFPEGFLDALMKDHVCAGVAIIEGNDDYLYTFLQDEKALKTDVENLLNDYPDRECILSFGKGPVPFPKDDVQPHVALFNTAGEGETTMSVFLSGKGFEKYKGTGSSQREAFEKLILPQIITAGKLHSDAADETYTDLASNPAMATLMNMIAGEDGWITIVSNEGQNTWSGGTKRNDFDWGWSTDLCGWKDKAAAAPAKASGFGKRPEGLKAETRTATAQVSLPDTTNEKTTADPNGVQGVDWDYFAPPSTWTKDQKRKAYVNADRLDGPRGIAPEGYKDCPKIKVRLKKTEPIKSFADIPKPEVVSSNVTYTTEEDIPVISAKSMGYLKNTFAKKGHVQATMSNGKVIVDPKRIERMTKDEWPTFVEKAGVEGLEDVKQALFYTHAERMELIKNTPDAAAVLMADISVLAVQCLQALDMVESKSGETVKHEKAKEILKPVVDAAKKAAGGFGKRN